MEGRREQPRLLPLMMPCKLEGGGQRSRASGDGRLAHHTRQRSGHLDCTLPRSPSCRALSIKQVERVSWQLDSALHCLKASETAYVFAIDPQNSLFYYLNVPPGEFKHHPCTLPSYL